MRKYMGNKRFHALQAAVVKEGLRGTRGEPDLFCFGRDGTWFFAEAKAPRDALRKSQEKWFDIAKNALGANHQVCVYRVVSVDAFARTYK